MLINVRDMLELRSSADMTAQFAPFFSNEAAAVDYAVDKAITGWVDSDDEVVVGRSTEDRNIIVVDGPAYTMCCIPTNSTYISGYYEVVVARNKRPMEVAVDFKEHVEKFGFGGLSVMRMLGDKATSILYNDKGIMTYQGAELSEDNMRRLNDIYIMPDGVIWDDKEQRIKPITTSYKYKGSNYCRSHVSMQIGNEVIHKVHHLVYAAQHMIPLDIIRVLTRARGNWCDWYNTTDNTDIAMIREIRDVDKALVWSIDHIDDITSNNRIENLQMITKRANSVLRAIRRSNFEMTKY